MVKQSGLGDNLYIDGVNVSGDIGSLSRIGSGASPLDVTGIDKSAFERLLGLRDGSIEFTSFFNDADDQEHEVLSALPRTDVMVTYFRGTTLGNIAASVVAKQVNYDATRGTDGALTFDVQAQANAYGLEWGQMLTAGVRSDSSATNGSSIDTGSSKSFGLQAYLHVFSLTGDDVTVTIQDSADNSSFAALTGGGFTEVTAAPASERIQTGRTQTVRRYLRVATTGTFTDVDFAVMIVKNDATVTF